MRKFMKSIMAAGLAVAVIGIGSAVTSASYADAVKDRKAAMKTVAKSNKAMGKAAKAGDKAAAVANANALIASAKQFVTLFPKGTDRGKLGEKATRAKPEIWAEWSKFETANNAMIAQAMKVAAGDLSAAKAMGKTCGGCHKPFRGPKAKK